MTDLLANLTLDTILSDRMLLVGMLLMFGGPILFLIGFARFLSLRKTARKGEELFNLFHHAPDPDPGDLPPAKPAATAVSQPRERPEQPMYIEIMIIQIKTLNKKVNDLEKALESLSKRAAANADAAPAPSESESAGPNTPPTPSVRPPIMPL